MLYAISLYFGDEFLHYDVEAPVLLQDTRNCMECMVAILPLRRKCLGLYVTHVELQLIC